MRSSDDDADQMINLCLDRLFEYCVPRSFSVDRHAIFYGLKIQDFFVLKFLKIALSH